MAPVDRREFVRALRSGVGRGDGGLAGMVTRLVGGTILIDRWPGVCGCVIWW